LREHLKRQKKRRILRQIYFIILMAVNLKYQIKARLSVSTIKKPKVRTNSLHLGLIVAIALQLKITLI